MRKRRRRDAPDGAIGIGVVIGGACGAGLSVPVPASVLTVNETNGIASLMTQSPAPASVPVPIENETNGMLSPMTPSPMTPSPAYKPILSYFFISPISILETLSSNFSTGVIFSLVK